MYERLRFFMNSPLYTTAVNLEMGEAVDGGSKWAGTVQRIPK